MVVILLTPFIRNAGKGYHLLTTLFAAMIPLTSFYALTADRDRAIIILVIAAPFVIFDGVNLFLPNRYLMSASIGFGTILYGYIIFLLVRNLLSYRFVSADLIYCAIATYLLIGIMWSGVYMALEELVPGSFSTISEKADLLYFSFATLTTVGFGDITPQSILGKRLSVFEAAMGDIYLAVIVAMIVGRYMTMQFEQNIESEIKHRK
jgi:hypothetical protein